MINTSIKKAGNRPFSLLEILLACAVIVIGSGMCINGLWKSYQESSMKEAVTSIQKYGRFAQSLAQVTNSEVRLMFGQNGEHFTMWLRGDFRATSALKAYSRHKVALAHVKSTEPHYISFFPISHAAKKLTVTFTDESQATVDFDFTKQEQQKELYPEEVLKAEKESVHAN